MRHRSGAQGPRKALESTPSSHDPGGFKAKWYRLSNEVGERQAAAEVREDPQRWASVPGDEAEHRQDLQRPPLRAGSDPRPHLTAFGAWPQLSS
eukprot:g21489.t1